MRVLLLNNALDVGGVEINILRLVGELTGRGHEVTVGSSGGPLVADIQAAGARHHVLSTDILSPSTGPHARRALRRVLAAEQPDVVHVFSARTAMTLQAALFPRRGQRPAIVSSIMGLTVSPDEAQWRVLGRAFASSVAVDRLVVMAPAIEAVVRRLPVRRSRIVRTSVVGVPLPSPQGVREEVRAELGVNDGAVLVLTVGRLHPTKSHELFIAAAAHAARNDITWAIVGGGELQATLEQQIAGAGLTNVLLLGERLDVSRLLEGADVYVRPGVVEGFIGITVLEAQALEVPVVSFETEDVKLAIEDGVTGLLVPAGDSEALAAAVARLADDPQARRAIAQRGRRLVEERYALPRIVEGLERLYRDAVATKARGSRG